MQRFWQGGLGAGGVKPDAGAKETKVAVIELSNIRKSFGSLNIIGGVDLRIEDGEFVIFVEAIRQRQVDIAAPGRRA